EQIGELEEGEQGDDEGEDRRAARHRDHEGARRLAAQQAEDDAVEHRARQRQQRDPTKQLGMGAAGHHLSRLTSSTFIDSRLRNGATTTRTPPPPPAAAPTIPISTKIAPPGPPHARAKPTKARWAAFSTPSIDIRITIRLGRVSAPTPPIAKSSAERPITC